MNIFYLDENPNIAAQMMCDKHVVKMIVETAQILSTAHRVLDGSQIVKLSEKNRKLKYWELPDERESKLYKATHVNHPSSVWARECDVNYTWLYNHFLSLCAEYTLRYDKLHATWQKLAYGLDVHPSNIKECDEMTSVPKCMPDHYKVDSTVQSYRNYYKGDKSKMAAWNKTRSAPDWWNS